MTISGEKTGCYHCEKRYPGCHSECDTYKNWKKKRNEIKEKEYKAKREDAFFQEMHFGRKKEMSKIKQKMRKEKLEKMGGS